MVKKLITALLLVTLIVTAAVFIQHPATKTAGQQTATPANKKPTAILTKAITRQYTPDGQLDYVLTMDLAEQFKRFNKKNKPLPMHRGYTRLTQPALTLYDEQGVSPWVITSKQGTAENSGHLVILWGNVVATRTVGELEQKFVTSRLRVDIRRQQATSKNVVNVYSPQGRIRGKGMTLNLDTGLVELNSDVQGIYDVYQ